MKTFSPFSLPNGKKVFIANIGVRESTSGVKFLANLDKRPGSFVFELPTAEEVELTKRIDLPDTLKVSDYSSLGSVPVGKVVSIPLVTVVSVADHTVAVKGVSKKIQTWKVRFPGPVANEVAVTHWSERFFGKGKVGDQISLEYFSVKNFQEQKTLQGQQYSEVTVVTEKNAASARKAPILFMPEEAGEVILLNHQEVPSRETSNVDYSFFASQREQNDATPIKKHRPEATPDRTTVLQKLAEIEEPEE